MKNHVDVWRSLPTNPVILDAIKHLHIELGDVSPIQLHQPKQTFFFPSDREIINEEITKLLDKGVIEM